jgi:dynein heavy chain
MEKRRKGVRGPPPGSKMSIFIDDLNMPKKETYGAQPPLEIMRQWLDHTGWYERKTKDKVYERIEDLIFVTAMGFPGGGRSVISMRTQRHFNLIAYTNLGVDSIDIMFKTIMKHFLRRFDESVKDDVSNIVKATQDAYKTIGEQLRPRPATSHYLFNLRDMSKVV